LKKWQINVEQVESDPFKLILGQQEDSQKWRTVTFLFLI